MRKLIPRDYQSEGHAATWNFLHSTPHLNPLVVEPTGTGKSLQMAMLLWHLKTAYPSVRAISLAHVKELVHSNYRTLMGLWPAAPAGIYSAGLNQKEHRLDITFAGIASVAKKAALFKRIDFVLIDEAHVVNDAEGSLYNKFLADLRAVNPKLIVIGYTATGFRTKSGYLVDGPLFDDVCFDLSQGEQFVRLIEEGYLIRPVPKDPGVQLNSDNVKIARGEFDDKQASAELHSQNILEQAVDLTISAGVSQQRKAWLHFCQSIADADLVAEMFTHKGYPHEAVHSDRADRDDVLADFRRGDLCGVTNKDILTTGYDQPNIDLITALRLTRSPGLWVQMVGRGTRPVFQHGYDITTKGGRLAAIAASPKQTCLVLDFVGNTQRLGPINYPSVPKRRVKGKASGDMVRKCPECDTYQHISRTTCEECGHEFPPPERLQEDASEQALVRSLQIEAPPPPPPKEYRVESVHGMTCMRQEAKKEGGHPNMRVSYRCGFATHSEWICFEHPDKSYPRRKAREWWTAHAGALSPTPATVDEALARVSELALPKFIKLESSDRFPRVVGHDFVGSKFEAAAGVLYDPEPDPVPTFTTQAQEEDHGAYF